MTPVLEIITGAIPVIEIITGGGSIIELTAPPTVSLVQIVSSGPAGESYLDALIAAGTLPPGSDDADFIAWLNAQAAAAGAADVAAEAVARMAADDAEATIRANADNAEITARNNAIGTAVADEATARNVAITSAISAEAAARNTAITGAHQVFVQAAAPIVPSGLAYIWVQIGLGDSGTDWTIWFDDNP